MFVRDLQKIRCGQTAIGIKVDFIESNRTPWKYRPGALLTVFPATLWGLGGWGVKKATPWQMQEAQDIFRNLKKT